MNDVKVGVVNFGDIKEKELFANRDLPKGSKIVSFVSPRKMLSSEWFTFANKHKLPFDSCVHFMIGSKEYALYDHSFIDEKPIWYYLNHSKKPNTKARVIDTHSYRSSRSKPKTLNIVWVAIKNIKNGEEIRFDYGEPSDDWA